MTHTPCRLLRLKQLCALFNVSRSTIYNWIKRHPTFPKPTKVFGGRLNFWDADAVHRWLSEQQAIASRA